MKAETYHFWEYLLWTIRNYGYTISTKWECTRNYVYTSWDKKNFGVMICMSLKQCHASSIFINYNANSYVVTLLFSCQWNGIMGPFFKLWHRIMTPILFFSGWLCFCWSLSLFSYFVNSASFHLCKYAVFYAFTWLNTQLLIPIRSHPKDKISSNCLCKTLAIELLLWKLYVTLVSILTFHGPISY